MAVKEREQKNFLNSEKNLQDKKFMSGVVKSVPEILQGKVQVGCGTDNEALMYILYRPYINH